VRIVLDTNVFVSGVFFDGPSYQILKTWRDGNVQMVISQEILEEYQRVGETLADQFPGVDLGPILQLLTLKAELTQAPSLPEPVCDDPDDDKFLACALASNSEMIISGDKHLLKVSGYCGINVLRPRKFLDDFLEKQSGD
jgi:putative PIN family toxin of toxin-antitoxin system